MSDLIEIARKHLSKLCENPDAFRMSIPVQKDDSDIIFGDALNYAKAQKQEITRLKSELERVKKIAHELADFYGSTENWRIADEYAYELIAMPDIERLIYMSSGIETFNDYGGKLARAKKKELEELG